MDYWSAVELHRHIAYPDFLDEQRGRRIRMLTTRGATPLWEAGFQPGDTLLFGPESRGLPADLLRGDPEGGVRIPMLPDCRSLNLATAVGIALFEALRQTGWVPENTRVDRGIDGPSSR